MKQSTSVTALDLIEDILTQKRKESRKGRFNYLIPSLWIPHSGKPKKLRVNPYSFYLETIKRVKRTRPIRRKKTSRREWTRDAVVYNMFVRTTAAFDHNGNGKLDLTVNDDRFRETGTFLKAIVLLPYIKRLGANTIHLLPITSIGHDGNKGTLGSPYAICNPHVLNENLSEHGLGLDAKTEFKAFVEAAHRLGLRVVVEFVFRTFAKDGDWVKEHPEWFYWIKDEVQMRDSAHLEESKYGSPVFSKEELIKIHRDVDEERFYDLLPPHQVHREFFTEPPSPKMVSMQDGRYVGVLDDGTRLKIPGAFSDWPPDDNQPPWGDVTYLRMYTHPDFNYMGYNTIRMYDSRLTEPRYVNRELWDRIIGIIPYYQREFHIDGVMIDMGHAMPIELRSKLIEKARELDPDFAFWDEDFAVTSKTRQEGYNAVIGYLWFVQHRPSEMQSFLIRCTTEGFPMPFFATSESHNTPRAAARPGTTRYSMWTWVVDNFLPGIPFIHSGFELAEKYPINTGLDFTAEEQQQYPSECLPLFSEFAYEWDRKEQLTKWIAKVSKIRAKYKNVIINLDPQSFVVFDQENENILGFARCSKTSKKKLAVIANTNCSGSERASLSVDTPRKQVVDMLSGKRISVEGGHIKKMLLPGQCLVFEY